MFSSVNLIHYFLSIFVFPVHNPIGADALYQNASLVTPRRKLVTFTPLDEDEIPKEKDLIGIDAEFVTLNQVSTKEVSIDYVTL